MVSTKAKTKRPADGRLIMGAKRTTISLPAGLYKKAQEIMRAKHFTDFSGFVAQLIRQEAERHDTEIIRRKDANPTP